jgi:subtilase family serine protease
VERFTIENLDLSEPDRDNITVNATLTSKYANARNVQVALFIDRVNVANKTVAAVPEDEDVNVLLTYELASSNKGEHTIQVVVDPNNEIMEKNEVNNYLVTVDTIGEVEDEEFNWQPYVILTGLIIILAIIYGYWRYRRRI